MGCFWVFCCFQWFLFLVVFVGVVCCCFNWWCVRRLLRRIMNSVLKVVVLQCRQEFYCVQGVSQGFRVLLVSSMLLVIQLSRLLLKRMISGKWLIRCRISWLFQMMIGMLISMFREIRKKFLVEVVDRVMMLFRFIIVLVMMMVLIVLSRWVLFLMLLLFFFFGSSSLMLIYSSRSVLIILRQGRLSRCRVKNSSRMWIRMVLVMLLKIVCLCWCVGRCWQVRVMIMVLLLFRRILMVMICSRVVQNVGLFNQWIKVVF